MGHANTEKIRALRRTAARLREGAAYQWGHAGACNCGHLAQQVTGLDSRAIYRQVGGEWSEHLRDYCPITGDPLDDVTARLIRMGFSPSELRDLERLSDPRVLAALPEGGRHLRHNERAHVIRYLESWAALLEAAPETSPATQAA